DDAVWECSHLGGHRFAATGVLLPWGYVYGRLTPASVADVLTEARRGRLHPDGLRGRSSSTPAGQVAELEVRRAQGLWGVGDVAPTAILQRRDRAEVTCRLPKGSEVTVTLTQVDLPDTLPASCGADPVGERRWVPQAPESHWPTPEPICT
ncbi:MAG: hypothetical protein QG597_3740, partial [Actinomycetota bacterium]|nr:hypothetical protein [Actinomycetota bacterium]